MLVDGLFFADELRGMMPNGVSWLAARGLATPDEVACAEAGPALSEGLPMTRKPAYDAKRRQDAEAPAASE